MLLAQNIASGWGQIPLFWNRYGDHWFFILNLEQPVAPPAENSPLGLKDAAMFAELEASFPEMNEAVDESVALARNTPPPAPPDPESRKFWRVHCDWSLDTDLDGSPDWTEFEMAAKAAAGQPVGVVGDFQGQLLPVGNAFNFDSNGDGIPDGDQLDTDLDGIADALDIAKSDATATYVIGPLPRYAVFPITNAVPAPSFSTPFQISDKGTVLYENGTWAGGVWTPLVSSGGEMIGCWALAINDHNVILGEGRIERETEVGPLIWHNVCHWPSPSGAPQAISVANSEGEVFPGFDYQRAYGGDAFAPVLSNDGRFFAHSSSINDTEITYLHPGEWKLPSDGQPAIEASAVAGLRYNQEPGLKWGEKWSGDAPSSKGLVYAPNALPEAPFIPHNVAALPHDRVLAMPPSTAFDLSSMVFYNESWHLSPTYAKAIDISADGTAIGRSHDGKTAPILLNGKWTEIKRYAPDVPSEWDDINTALLDTTPGGWILGKRNNGTASGEHAVMLPIFLKGITPSQSPILDVAGVDDFSIRSEEPGDAVQDRLWIMAPSQAGVTEFTLKPPLNANTPLKLSATGIRFNGATEKTVTEAQNAVTIESWSTEPSGTEIPLKLEMNDYASVSSPISVKIMKDRNIKVGYYLVTKETADQPDNTADLFPSASQIQTYLNARI